ncbi:hypothetical protein GCM10020256_54850 [Streptomyces thermocoprophilus]
MICTAVAFVAFLELIKEAGPTRATVITYVNPAVAVAAGALFLGEALTATIVAAFAPDPHGFGPGDGRGIDRGIPPGTMVHTADEPGGRPRGVPVRGASRGTSGLHRAGWWLTATRGDPRDSATESKPPGASALGKGETVV